MVMRAMWVTTRRSQRVNLDARDVVRLRGLFIGRQGCSMFT